MRIEVFEGDVNQITIQKDDTLLKQTKEQWVYIAFYLTAELQKVKKSLSRSTKERKSYRTLQIQQG
jgi:hypothetical protein